MELTESIEAINQRLIDYFGIDTVTGLPIWRVVWSEDQLEKRKMDVTDSGLQLLFPEVREVPKYRQWIQEKYVLERLTVIPEVSANELPTSKLSYEPMFVFEDKNGNYLPPKTIVAKFVIDGVYSVMGKSSLHKYVDESITPEAKEKNFNDIYDYLYGDETSVSDSLGRKEGIVVPSNFKNH